jgi:hypothetical protein
MDNRQKEMLNAIMELNAEMGNPVMRLTDHSIIAIEIQTIKYATNLIRSLKSNSKVDNSTG